MHLRLAPEFDLFDNHIFPRRLKPMSILQHFLPLKHLYGQVTYEAQANCYHKLVLAGLEEASQAWRQPCIE